MLVHLTTKANDLSNPGVSLYTSPSEMLWEKFALNGNTRVRSPAAYSGGNNLT